MKGISFLLFLFCFISLTAKTMSDQTYLPKADLGVKHYKTDPGKVKAPVLLNTESSIWSRDNYLSNEKIHFELSDC